MIINLTQHKATKEQVEAGVVDLGPEQREELKRLLTFDTIPSGAEIHDRARHISHLALSFNKAMIGGAPYLMGPLERRLCQAGLDVLYAFSRRESEEVVTPDGSTKKVTVFRHIGFVGE